MTEGNSSPGRFENVAAANREILSKNLYGDHFNREIGAPYRIPCHDYNVLIKRLKHSELLGKPFYCTVYDFNHNVPIRGNKNRGSSTYNYRENVILDKIFFDFDKDYNPSAKTRLQELDYNPVLKKEFIINLMEHGRIKEPIDQAIGTAQYLRDTHGGEPLLVFSGSKGCHLYYFFEPVMLDYPKEVLSRFTRDLKDQGLFNFNTDEEPGLLDTAPVGDVARISRVPGSIHPETGLYCHPFKMDFNYGEIISNAQEEDPPYADFNPVEMRSPTLRETLIKYDEIVRGDMELQRYQRAFMELEPRQPTPTGGDKIHLQGPEDILKLNQFPCFKEAPFNHAMRILLGLICLWTGLSDEDTLEAIRTYGEDRGTVLSRDNNKGKYFLSKLRGSDGNPKYLFSCRSMKKHNLCRECNQWFYLNLELPEEFHNRIDEYKRIQGGEYM
jgi:hypothetical protein